MDAERQSGQADGVSPQQRSASGEVPVQQPEASALVREALVPQQDAPDRSRSVGAQLDAGGQEPCGPLRYRPWQRLRGQRAFRRERNIGVYRHSGAALVRVLPAWELETPEGDFPQRVACRRLGVVASRKVGNAVARNRAKRVWREIFRLNQQLLPTPCDVLVIVRKDFAIVTRADLDALFADVARRARRAFGAVKR